MDSRRNSTAEKKGGGFKLLDIAQGTVPEDIEQAIEETLEMNTTKVSEEDESQKKTDSAEEKESKPDDEESKTEDNSEEAPVKATIEDCLKLLRESFDGYDYNGNGTVAHEEVREAWIMCQEEWNEPCDPERCNLEATIFMKDIDKGGDDQVDFEEYVKYFRYLWLLSQGHEVSEEKEQ